jgi:N-acetylmuramoyl-L-alanine amidase
MFTGEKIMEKNLKPLSWLRKKQLKVFLDPGHGGLDDGAVASPGMYLYEDEVNLTIGLYLDLMLRLKRFDTMLSRNRDIGLSLHDRCEIANGWGASIFVSLHVNSFTRPGPSGFGVYVYSATTNPDTQRLAETINTHLVEDFPDHVQRGIYGENFYVLKKTRMPAILVECEFISNPKQAEWIRKVENRFLMAASLSRGIEDFFAVVGRRPWRKQE